MFYLISDDYADIHYNLFCTGWANIAKATKKNIVLFYRKLSLKQQR